LILQIETEFFFLNIHNYFSKNLIYKGLQCLHLLSITLDLKLVLEFICELMKKLVSDKHLCKNLRICEIASHNLYYENGLKIWEIFYLFDEKGIKMEYVFELNEKCSFGCNQKFLIPKFPRFN
jgi:hypothetical protein